jgi:hypothetical protein
MLPALVNKGFTKKLLTVFLTFPAITTEIIDSAKTGFAAAQLAASLALVGTPRSQHRLHVRQRCVSIRKNLERLEGGNPDDTHI